MPPICSNTPVCPQCSPVHQYVLRGMWYGDAGAPPYVWTPHMFGCLPICPTPSHTSLCSLVCLYVLGSICMLYGGYTPYVGGLGHQHICQAFGVSVHPLDVHYASSCTFLVVNYVFSLYYHSYNHRSSSDCGVFWYVISFISDHGSLFDGVSCNIGSVWCGSATTIDTEVSWRCFCPSFCAKVATPIFDVSSGLCQLYHGFFTGRFLFQSLASHFFVYYMFGVCSGVCFPLPGAMLDAIFTPGGSTIEFCTIVTLWSLPEAGIYATWWWSSAHIRYAQSGCSLHYLV